jgi:hypothetical protein
MHRYAQYSSLEVPECDVDYSEEPDRELVGPVELPEAVPQPLATVGPLANELIPEHAVDDVGQHRAAPLMVGLADRPLVRRDSQYGGRPGLRRAAEPAPPGERRGDRRKGDQVDIDCRDDHCGI